MSRRPHPAAYTLVESLVTIALLAVVIGLVVPTLARARIAAQQMASVSNIRTHAQTLHSYAHDFEDYSPFLADPHATYTVFRHAGVTITAPFFYVDSVWNFPLAQAYYDDRHDHKTFRLPWNQHWAGTSDYLLSDTLFTRPEYWDPFTRRSGVSQWRPTRFPEIAFPSAKGTLIERLNRPSDAQPTEPLGVRRNRLTRAAFADGSASSPRSFELTRPYPRGAGPVPPATFSYGVPVLHTINGVLGRDSR